MPSLQHFHQFRPFAYCFFFLFTGIVSASTSFSQDTIPLKQGKLLILIISSDNHPVYPELRKVWRSYMHLYPEKAEAYFLHADPNLPDNYVIRGDELWTKCKDSLFRGILEKTLLSLNAFLPRMEEFDYVLRTNLSSFYILPRLYHSRKINS